MDSTALPRWGKPLAFVIAAILLIKALAGLGWILFVLVGALWIACLAGLLYRTGRLQFIGDQSRLGLFLEWLTEEATPSASAGTQAGTNTTVPGPVAIPTTRRMRPPPPPRPKPSKAFNAEELAKQLKEAIIGQDRVCEEVSQTLRIGMAQKNRKKPLGAFLFAGAPGIGKTFMATQLARISQRNLLNLDMSQYSEPHTASSLFGLPAGYAGSDSYGVLTGELRRDPSTVVLLDGFEKTSASIQKMFRSAFSEGSIKENSNSDAIPTRDAVFILTTNAAHEQLSEISATFKEGGEKLEKAMRNVLREHSIENELLERLDHILLFSPFSELDMARVAILEITRYVKTFDIDVFAGGIAPELLFDLVRRGKREHFSSVSELCHSIEKSCGPQLAAAKERGVKRVRLLYSDNVVEVKDA